MGSRSSEISVDPEVMSGTPVFRGTRVPVKALFDYFEGGQTLAQFLGDFPSVSHQQAIDVLEHAKELLTAGAPSAL